jgi:hypothetical protein
MSSELPLFEQEAKGEKREVPVHKPFKRSESANLIMITLMIVGLLFSGFNTRATLDQSRHVMLVEYEIGGLAPSEGVENVEIFLHHEGNPYLVAVLDYPEPVTSLLDTFVWFSRDQWESGNLEVIFRKMDNSSTIIQISEAEIQIGFFPIEHDTISYLFNSSISGVIQGADEAAWRQVWYDVGRTSYYPFPMYPPFDSMWTRVWGYAGDWCTMISGSAGHSMLYLPKKGQWNKVNAEDIETGQIIWERYVTANNWTTALSVGDSILFVGTSIGFSPDQDTTFYALNPMTGELKWALTGLGTVEYSPLVVDTFVFAPSLQADTVRALTLRGELVWKERMTYRITAYADEKIYGPRYKWPYFPEDTTYILYCRDALNGDSVWAFAKSYDIAWPSIQNENLHFFSRDTLYVLRKSDGSEFWKMQNQPQGTLGYPRLPLTHYSGRTYFTHSEGTWETIISTRVEVFDSETGEEIGNCLYAPKDSLGGISVFALITKDDWVWVTCPDYIRSTLHGDSLISEILLPESQAIWPCWFFPICYDDNFIYAHEDFLCVYEAQDTISQVVPPDTSFTINIQPLQKGTISFVIQSPEQTWVEGVMYDCAGKSISKLFDRSSVIGVQEVNVTPSETPSGIYFILIRTGKGVFVERFVYLKGG